ncbi:MAG TPA: NAD(P)-binding domain-containing protein [Solirubrobacteraceae bacterium]|jgi:8-hydroxy-5-deazaflavin:NADPH oxidoreductase|nr:NAD(P)-binding domain-containing protein [Solirubrobacteraceae bacterium]
MNVGIIGSGQVAQALARGFVALGHQVKLGSRTPEKLSDFVEEQGDGASAGTFAEAAEFGELGVVATLWSGTEQALELADGRRSLAGKIVIDVTNPLVFHEGGPPSLALGHTDSGGEQVQRWLPESRVVKAFNIVGNTLFFRPDLPGGPPTMFICGDDEQARGTVGRLVEDFGWPEVVDIGGIEGARLLEPVCILWVLYGVRTGGFEHAVKMLRR